MNHLNEYREHKKSKSYYIKLFDISKIELRDLCLKLNLNEEIKYLGSGAWGNAYKVGDKVLKITDHKNEAKSIYDLIENSPKNSSIVTYYSVNMFKHKGEYLYAIVMDYIPPLEMFLKKKYDNYKGICEMVDFILDILFDNWGNLKSYTEFTKLISVEYKIYDKTIYFIKNFWILYKNLSFLPSCPDLHIGNIGIKNDKFILFDYSKLKYIRKFNEPSILK